MNKLMFAIIMLFALLFAGCAGIIPQEPVACTMEAKLCPDGSAVGRTGPNCEFAPCPTGGNTSECGTCPMLVQPGPNFCSEGVIVAGVVNDCGCRGPPSCACTEEAKVCPDGSAVGRTEPNCAFAPCPEAGGGQNAEEEFLFSHKWRLAVVDFEPIEDSPVYIQFDKGKGTFWGNAGCNSISGTYTLDGDQISFEQTAITLMYCEDTMDLETKVLEKINGGPYRWYVTDPVLTLYKGEEMVMIWGVDSS